MVLEDQLGEYFYDFLADKISEVFREEGFREIKGRFNKGYFILAFSESFEGRYVLERKDKGLRITHEYVGTEENFKKYNAVDLKIANIVGGQNFEIASEEVNSNAYSEGYGLISKVIDCNGSVKYFLKSESEYFDVKQVLDDELEKISETGKGNFDAVTVGGYGLAILQKFKEKGFLKDWNCEYNKNASFFKLEADYNSDLVSEALFARNLSRTG